MKKVTKIIALLLAVIMVFTGCATYNETTVINSDGSARVTSVLDVDKEQLDAGIKKLGYSNPEAYIKEWLYDYSYYEVVTIDGKQYYEIRDIQAVKAKELANGVNNALYVSEKGLYVTKDTVYGKVDIVMETFEDDFDDMKEMGINTKGIVKVKLVFEFPDNIVASTGTVDSANPKKVTFDIDADKKPTIFATTNKANTYSSIKKKVDKQNTVKKPTIKSLKVTKIKGKKGTVTLKLKKMKGVTYSIEYSTSKKFSYLKTDYKTTKKTTATLKNLKKGKKYYVRVYAYKTNYANRYVVSKAAKKTVTIK